MIKITWSKDRCELSLSHERRDLGKVFAATAQVVGKATKIRKWHMRINDKQVGTLT